MLELKTLKEVFPYLFEFKSKKFSESQTELIQRKQTLGSS